MAGEVSTDDADEETTLLLHLTVSKMDGSSVQLEISSDSPVMSLKTQIKQQWDVSELCQKLVVAGVEPEDFQKIGETCSDRDDVLLVVSNERVYEYLQHPQPKMRLMAVEAIKDVRQLDYVQAVSRLAQLARKEREASIRSAVVVALSSIASRDDEKAAAALANFAKDEIMSCQVAVNAIVAMMIEGSPSASRVMEALLKMSSTRDLVLAREEMGRIQQVLAAIGKQAEASEKGTGAFVKALSWAVRGVGGCQSSVRAIALRFCAKMVKRGDKDIIDIYRDLRNDPETDVRIAVAEGLGTKLPDYSPGVVQGILPMVGDKEAAVREASLRALRTVKCEKAAMSKLSSAIIHCLGDSDPGVRFAAVETLSELAHRGDNAAAAAVARLPEDFE